MIEHPLYLPLAAFPVGVLIGLTGIGGAALMTPLLILGFGVRPELAIGTDLLYSTFTKAVGSWMHWRQGHVDFKLVATLATGSIPGATLGTWATNIMYRSAQGDAHLKSCIGLVLLIVSIGSLVPLQKPVRAIDPRRTRQLTLIYSLIAGFLVGWTSIGSGSFILPLLVLVNRLTMVRAVGTDIFHAFILIAFSAALRGVFGEVNWHMAGWLVAGSVPGVAIGSRLSPLLATVILRFMILAVLVAVAFRLIL